MVQFYIGGVLTHDCGTDLDHGVLAVGFGTLDGVDYWKVKNSWNAKWGMDGYVLIQRGVNKCGIGNDPSYPVVNGEPAPPPAPRPPVAGDCTIPVAQAECLRTTMHDEVCTWCEIGGFGFCTVPDYSCNSASDVIL